MTLATHGRWPILGAAGLLPVTAAAIRDPRLRPLAALLWHQTEEWVWPGSFLPWINREVLGSGQDEFPIDRRMGFIVNVVLGWGGSLAAAEPALLGQPAASLYVSHLGNIVLHTSWAVRHRRYDPGLITAWVTLAPVAVTGLRELAANPQVSRGAVKRGALGGLAASAGLIPFLKLRIRRSR